jgi:alpha-1,6-mannosyltransferase
VAQASNAEGGPTRWSPAERPRGRCHIVEEPRLCEGAPGLKIVDITEFYSERGGGIRSHLSDRGRFLAERDHSHLVIASGPRNEEAVLGGGSRRGKARLIRLAGPALPYDPTYHLLHRVDKIRQRVRAERPDVLEAHSPYLATAGVIACGKGAARLNTAFWHSDHLGVHVQPALTRLLGERPARAAESRLRQCARMLLAPFDATFVAGRAQAEYLTAAGVPRVIVAPFGVDTRTFRPSARHPEWRRKWLGEDNDAVLIVGLGRFAGEKRWDVVLDAFGHFRARRKAVMVLFGDGPERRRLEERAPSGVHFVGFEADRRRLATALASSDVLVHGGPFETFGLGIAEGVACGLPIVVPDSGGAAERAESACGITYRSLDPWACAAAIERLFVDSPAERRVRSLDAAARARSVEDHFGSVLGAYDDLLRDVRETKRRPNSATEPTGSS